MALVGVAGSEAPLFLLRREFAATLVAAVESVLQVREQDASRAVPDMFERASQRLGIAWFGCLRLCSLHSLPFAAL